MIVLLDTGQDLATCAAELGCEVGQLLTPLTRYTLREPTKPWAIDNGAYSGFEEKAFFALLEREKHRKDDCLFVTVPDVVGSARRTLELFDRFRMKIFGWKIAFACQDGQEDLPIPWDYIDAIFIGGSTNWKLSDHAAQCIRTAQALGIWAHVGRVNDPARFAHFEKLGADSIDGSGIARYTHMRDAISKRDNQEKLFCAS